MNYFKFIISFFFIFLLPVNVYGFTKIKSQKTVFSDANYVFVCSSIPNLDAKSVSDFYLEYFPENKNVQISDGIAIEEIDHNKKYLLLSFATKPLSHSNIDCLNDFPEIPEKWIDQIIEQSEIVGTIPEYYKTLPLGKYYNPVKSRINTFCEKNFSLHSSISINENVNFACGALWEIFDFDYNASTNKLGCNIP